MHKMHVHLLLGSFCLLCPLSAEQAIASIEGEKASLENQAVPDSPPQADTHNVQGTTLNYDSNVSDQNHHSTLSQAPQDTAGDRNDGNTQETFKTTDSQNSSLNSAVRPPLKNALNIWLCGEALLWQAIEENLTYVYSTDQAGKTDLKTVDFNWDFGFRVSGGYNLPYDSWDLSLMWTHIENKASASKNAHLDVDGNGVGNLPYLQAAWGINDLSPPEGTISKASAHWDVHLDQVDLCFGREYSLSSHFIVRPHVGMRADWIDQNYKVNYTFFSTFSPQKFKMNNRFFGFGFLAGANTDWLLGQGFSIFGTADFALLLGYFKVDQKVSQLNLTEGPQKGDFDSSFRAGRSIFDLNLGVKWHHFFDNRSWGLTFKAGYEYHLYFDQNQLFNLTETTSPFRSNKTQGNLIYQGVFLSGQFDF